MEAKRDLRLDLVRVIAVLGVVTLHVVGSTSGLEQNKISLIISDLWLGLAHCSVNLFGLLSGYLKIDRKQHNASGLKILVSTLFWCLVMAFLGAVFFHKTSVQDILVNIFPFLANRLWYISCYLFVFLCAPFLNFLANRLSRKGYKRLLLILAVLMVIIPTVFMVEPFGVVNKGYSAGWLIFLYLLGGFYKKFGFSHRMTKRICGIVLVLSVILMVVSKYGLMFIRNVLHSMFGIGGLISASILFEPYNSPLVLLNSVLILYLCVNSRGIKSNAFGKTIKWISTVSLGIYIIHAHPLVLDCILTDTNMNIFIHMNPLIVFIMLCGIIIGVAIFCGLLEQIRIWIFRFCNINNLLGKLGKKMDSLLEFEDMTKP